jgi:2-polyprenyl-3-methyl-5-hydroxy-6-metoxy-1,4-benzoquinol methylase
MMRDSIEPLKAEKFLQSALGYIEPLKGTHIYNSVSRDYVEKTDISDAGYGTWLKELFAHLTHRYKLPGKRVLDFGCGTGELTVRMRTLGYEAYGYDLHERHLILARILAAENGVPADAFILGKTGDNPHVRLPFEDGSFDIITLLSVLEHLSDATLAQILPELRRICRGVLYVLAPNRLKTVDDHTGLRCILWFPRFLAAPYVKLRGRKSGYHISADGTWDVYSRGPARVLKIFRKHGFHPDFPPDRLVFPSVESAPPIKKIGKHLTLGNRKICLGIPLPYETSVRLGCPPHFFLPYLNLIFRVAGRN